MNVPNLISVFRLLLVPVFLIFLVGNSYHPLAALVVFVVAALSDAVDGIIARKTKTVSPFGVFLDPMADKLLLLSAFVALAYIRIIPEWLAIIVVFRDIILFIGWVGLNILKNINIISPSIISKIATFFQMFTVVSVTSKMADIIIIPDNMLNVIFVITGLLTVITGLHYIIRAVKFTIEKKVTID
ncbi:MAG: CDP-alcohol phosphatidyltransferase family protein [Elusimicrobiota bacterium]